MYHRENNVHTLHAQCISMLGTVTLFIQAKHLQVAIMHEYTCSVDIKLVVVLNGFSFQERRVYIPARFKQRIRSRWFRFKRFIILKKQAEHYIIQCTYSTVLMILNTLLARYAALLCLKSLKQHYVKWKCAIVVNCR